MKRDLRIDALRSLGIILIVLAHVHPPIHIIQLRVFDVPLMSMLLGMSYVLSSTKTGRATHYGDYLLKRFKRLVIPTWTFLTLFFICIFFASLVLKIDFPYTIKIFATSYSLISGIGYVWIIRVFFTIAIFSPFLLTFSKKIKSIPAKLITFIFLLLIQQVLCFINGKLMGISSNLFQTLVSISFGYIIIALIGMWAIQQTKKENLIFSLTSLTGFLIIGLLTGFPFVSNQKYPPTVYFILFGIGVSLLLFYLISNGKVESFLNKEGVIWLSKHSLELYYWHIFPVTFFEVVAPDIVWWTKFLIVISSSLIMTYIQSKYIPNFFQPTLKGLRQKKS